MFVAVLERSQEVDFTALLADMKHSRYERALQAQKIVGTYPLAQSSSLIHY
jgi:hypothetical protein